MKKRKSLVFKALLIVILFAVIIPFIIPFKYSLPPLADLQIYAYTEDMSQYLTAAQVADLYEDINLLEVRRRFPLFNFNSSFFARDVTELSIASHHGFHTRLYIFSNNTPSFIDERDSMQFVLLEEDQLQQIRRKVHSYQNAK